MLGILLVQRGSRFLGFTAEGERALDWARRIVGDLRAMREEINACARPPGHLRIAAIPTALAIVARLTTLFRARHPDVRFTILSRTSIEILARMKSRDRRRRDLSRQRAARPRQRGPLYQKSYRCSPPPTRRSRIAIASPRRKPRRCRSACSHLTCGAGASSTGCSLRRRRPATDARSEFDGPAVRACAHRPLGQHDAGAARRSAGLTATVRGSRSSTGGIHTIRTVVPPREPLTPLAH